MNPCAASTCTNLPSEMQLYTFDASARGEEKEEKSDLSLEFRVLMNPPDLLGIEPLKLIVYVQFIR